MLTIHFDLSQFENVELINLADVHIGNPLCNEAELKRIIDYIKEEPEDPTMARICLLNGDLTESVTKSSRVGNVFEMTMTPSVQVATMIKYLLPLTETSKKYPQGKILSYCAGNHDEGRYKDTGISASESIAVGLGLEDRYSVDGCYSFIKLHKINHVDKKTAIATVYNQHMTSGSTTIGGKANRIAKIGSAVVANVICGAHVHSPITFKEDIILPSSNSMSLVQQTITYCITGAFLRYGDYAQRNGMKPSTICIPRIYIRQNRSQANDRDLRFIYTEVLL